MEKIALDDFAVFGGEPLFRTPRSIGQLHTPDFEAFRPKLLEILRGRRLTNNGPFVQDLERRLAELHQVEHCVAVASAALGLFMLMQILGRNRPGEIVVPAFTYPGLPHFVQWAGHEPAFCDVDPVTHMLCLDDFERRINAETRAVLVVTTSYASVPLERYEAIAAERNTPVFFDSVCGLGKSHGGRPLGGNGVAEVFSLHATKLLNGFEGGYVTTNDATLARKLISARNFLYGPPPPEIGLLWGLNAKLNEVHAAMALLSLDAMPGLMRENRVRYEAYAAALRGIEGLSVAPYVETGDDYNYEMVVLELDRAWPLTRDQTIAVLRAEGAFVNNYYAPALHLSEHCPAGKTPPHLPIAEALAERFIRLPAGDGTSTEDIATLANFLQQVQRRGAEIAARLPQGDRG